MPRQPFHAFAMGLALVLCHLNAPAAPKEAAPPPPPPDWTDPQTQLVWSRCVEGMQWTGKTCSGQPLLLSHAQAVSRASARAREDGLAWRVPRVQELRRLLEKAGKPGLDSAQFPAAPQDWHWTATANLQQSKPNPYNYGNVVSGRGAAANDTPFLLGWAVDVATGEARGDIPKSRPLPVRLVRSAP